MYNGLVEDVSDYFGDRGHPLPPKYNPADWIMNVAQSVPLDELNQKGFFLEDERKLPEPFTDHVDGKDELGITLTERHIDGDFDAHPVGWFTQLYMLFSRELKNLTRDTAAVGARFGLTIFLSCLVGVIFLDVGTSDPSQPQVSSVPVVFFTAWISPVCYLIAALSVELEQSIRSTNHGRYDVNVRYSSTRSPSFSGGAPGVLERVLDESLLGFRILSVEVDYGGFHYCTSNPCASRHYLLLD